jgi:hypothetical protein
VGNRVNIRTCSKQRRSGVKPGGYRTERSNDDDYRRRRFERHPGKVSRRVVGQGQWLERTDIGADGDHERIGGVD